MTLDIRKVLDDSTPQSRLAIAEAQAILHAQSSAMSEVDIEDLPKRLRDRRKDRFRTMLFVAADARKRVRGVAVLGHAPDLNFCFLDALAVVPGRSGASVGSLLYERVREEAIALKAVGLFLECPSDDPQLCPDPERLRQNRERLKLYERFGARPIVGTQYESLVKPGDSCSPHLVLDPLGSPELPSRERLRAIVRAILEHKHAGLCAPAFIEMVVDSIRDDLVRLRPPRERRRWAEARKVRLLTERIPLVVNTNHALHHVRERGYVESPLRIRAILGAIEGTGLVERVPAQRFGDHHIRAVHDGQFIDYLARACRDVGEEGMLYPYVFPLRNTARPPRERSVLAGYWCFDTFTPINLRFLRAAREAVDCTLTAADLVLQGARFAYALVRPPGHHAERRAFGGFCYFCNGAIAAHYLSRYGRVAILDIDYHHGNGQQDIFYHRSDVFTVSIHGHPSFAYPYFAGFRDEIGIGPGTGFNLNLPLPKQVSPDKYLETLDLALSRIRRYAPHWLVLSLGFDTAKGDPTGTWSLSARDFFRIGHAIGAFGLPVVIVQEGGYRIATLGIHARNFLRGLAEGSRVAKPQARPQPPRSPALRIDPAQLSFRDALQPGDEERVRALVATDGLFRPEEVEIAIELVREATARGSPQSGYWFLFAESEGMTLGYACYGPIAGTDGRFDLYWIVVDAQARGRGLGRALLAEAERRMAMMGAKRIYIETSSTELYRGTRRFYAKAGYRRVAVLPDFYRPGDGKVVYLRELAAREP